MISFRPALRQQTPLIIGLAGPSRSGKTFSALRLAKGLASAKPIVMIDTESGRGLQYADRFQYLHGSLSSPFTPERYSEAIDDAMKIEPGVIIIDSLSHMHEGPGGVLEQHERELERMAGDDWKKRERVTFSAWIKPKAAVNRFVNKLLQTQTHFILCFRAKDKLKLVKGADPVHMGWTPICTDRMEYECSVLLVLPEGSQGTPDLDATSSGLRDPFQEWIKPNVQLTEELGKRFAEWSSHEAVEPPKVGSSGILEKLSEQDRSRLADAAISLKEALSEGLEIQAWKLWNSLENDHKVALWAMLDKDTRKLVRALTDAMRAQERSEPTEAAEEQQ